MIEKKLKLLIKLVNNKSNENKKEKFNSKNLKRGSALAEVVLMTAISVVIIISLFYPQIISIFKLGMNNISTWFSMAISEIGVIK